MLRVWYKIKFKKGYIKGWRREHQKLYALYIKFFKETQKGGIFKYYCKRKFWFLKVTLRKQGAKCRNYSQFV